MHDFARIRLISIFCCFILGFIGASQAGESKRAPALLLANEIGLDVDPANYLVSEKYDGARAFWDGKMLRFRSGRSVNAPAWFLAKLPAQQLDGELWLGRGKFDELSGIVRKTEPVDAEWRRIKYMIFELPEGAGSFAGRVERIKEIVGAVNWPQLVAAEQFRLADRAALKRKLDEVVRGGGEGLMLHRADAAYVTGRSDALLKLKPLQDAEAVVLEHVAGKGKFAGMMGALRVRTADGKEFVIGTGFTDRVRKRPPPVGATITYTYRGFTNTGLPRFASYLRVREEF
jgi:DNA ligase-1